MRKTVALVIGWFLAGVGAVALASVAVGAVGDQVAPSDRPGALSADDVRAQLDADGTTTTTTSASDRPTSTTTSAPTTVDDLGGQADGGGGTVTTDDHDGERTATTGAPRPPSTGGSTAPASTTKTFNVVGGTVTLRFAASGVTVVTATPKAGFSVDTEPEHGNGVRVEFESDSHRSRVSGWWDGTARSEVREDTSGGGGDGSGGGSSGGPG